jgi:hypothetical protein
VVTIGNSLSTIVDFKDKMNEKLEIETWKISIKSSKAYTLASLTTFSYTLNLTTKNRKSATYPIKSLERNLYFEFTEALITVSIF